MRKMALLLCVCAVMTASALTRADADAVYMAYVTKNMTLWKTVIDRRSGTAGASLSYKEESINYMYGYVAWCLGDLKKRRDMAVTYLDKAVDALDEYEAAGGDAARVEAYRSAFIAYDMKLHPMKTPFIGMKSVRNAKAALKSDSADHFVHIQYGNVMYYLPEMLGGSKPKAISSYLKAKSIMDASTSLKYHNWLYMNLLLTLADAYKGVKMYDEVAKYYDLVLSIEPEFAWVRDSLYPSLRKMTGK